MELVIDIPEEEYNIIKAGEKSKRPMIWVEHLIASGTPLSKGHGRLGDLDELEQRISNFVEHDAELTDLYTVVRQRFIVNGIRETPTIIEADEESEK